MTSAVSARPQPRPSAIRAYDGRGLLGPGLAALYLGLIVLIPIAALVWQSFGQGLDAFLAAVTTPQALAALQLTFVTSSIVVLINAVITKFGTVEEYDAEGRPVRTAATKQ